MKIGEKIRVLRTSRNYNQQHLASLINVSRATIISYEKSNTKPNMQTLILLAKSLEVDLSEFTDLEDSFVNDSKKLIIPIERMESFIPPVIQQHYNGIANTLHLVYRDYFINLLPSIIDEAKLIATNKIEENHRNDIYADVSKDPLEISRKINNDYEAYFSEELKHLLIKKA